MSRRPGGRRRALELSCAHALRNPHRCAHPRRDGPGFALCSARDLGERVSVARDEPLGACRSGRRSVRRHAVRCADHGRRSRCSRSSTPHLRRPRVWTAGSCGSARNRCGLPRSRAVRGRGCAQGAPASSRRGSIPPPRRALLPAFLRARGNLAVGFSVGRSRCGPAGTGPQFLSQPRSEETINRAATRRATAPMRCGHDHGCTRDRDPRRTARPRRRRRTGRTPVVRPLERGGGQPARRSAERGQRSRPRPHRRRACSRGIRLDRLGVMAGDDTCLVGDDTVTSPDLAVDAAAFIGAAAADRGPRGTRPGDRRLPPHRGPPTDGAVPERPRDRAGVRVAVSRRGRPEVGQASARRRRPT